MAQHAPIVRISILPLAVPLHTSFAISKGAIEIAENAIVVCEDANGLRGIGEAAPFPVLTGDTFATVLPALQEMAKAVQEASDQNAQNVQHGQSARSALEFFYTHVLPDFKHVPSACTGLEMALWDLQAQQMGVPFSSLWGTSSRTSVHTDITLPIMDVSGLKSFWQRFENHQFPYVKVKVGVESVDTDVARIYELSKLMPKGARVSLDGNQGCTVASALSMVEKLDNCGIRPLFFEQPLPQDDWAGMQSLTARSSLPICADETVKTPADALRLVNTKAAHLVNLKLMKSGLLNTQKIITIVRAAGLDLMIGGMVETEVAMTASLHVLCGSGAVEWCDLDTPFFLSKRITRQSPYHSDSSLLECPKGIGLGLELMEL